MSLTEIRHGVRSTCCRRRSPLSSRAAHARAPRDAFDAIGSAPLAEPAQPASPACEFSDRPFHIANPGAVRGDALRSAFRRSRPCPPEPSLITSLGNCDPAVTRRLLSQPGIMGFVFRNWSGARDLNPGPHGPEPCRCRVLRCPTDSRVVLANTKSTRLVSFGDPLEPSGAGNA
jgi:hypothetical protein